MWATSDETVLSLGRVGTPFVLNLDATTLFMSSGMFAFIIGVAFTGIVGRAFGKRNALMALTLANAVTILGFFYIPPDAVVLMFVMNLVGNLLAGPTPALVWALYTDVADYGEWKFGRRATGLVFSAAMFAQKMGLTIGGAASGWLLGGLRLRGQSGADSGGPHGNPHHVLHHSRSARPSQRHHPVVLPAQHRRDRADASRVENNTRGRKNTRGLRAALN